MRRDFQLLRLPRFLCGLLLQYAAFAAPATGSPPSTRAGATYPLTGVFLESIPQPPPTSFRANRLIKATRPMFSVEGRAR